MGVKGKHHDILNDSFWRLRRGLNMSGGGAKLEEILNRLVMEPELGVIYGGRGGDKGKLMRCHGGEDRWVRMTSLFLAVPLGWVVRSAVEIKRMQKETQV